MMFGVNDEGSPWSAIALAPIFSWELSLGVWLVLKGFKPSPMTKAAYTQPAEVRQ